jgi:3-oxoacyl-[acyl-carrier protein] reductase
MLTELTQMRFADRVAVITGGANGIGRATAVLLAKEGAKVVAVDVEPQRLRELESSIHADGGSCTTFEADVLDAQAVECLPILSWENFGEPIFSSTASAAAR